MRPAIVLCLIAKIAMLFCLVGCGVQPATPDASATAIAEEAAFQESLEEQRAIMGGAFDDEIIAILETETDDQIIDQKIGALLKRGAATPSPTSAIVVTSTVTINGQPLTGEYYLLNNTHRKCLIPTWDAKGLLIAVEGMLAESESLIVEKVTTP